MALNLLARGLVTIAEAARIAEVTPQAMGKAARRAGIDAAAMRAAYLVELMGRPIAKRARPTKQAMRARADKALEMWNWRAGRGGTHPEAAADRGGLSVDDEL
jgi:hypothetical protein